MQDNQEPLWQQFMLRRLMWQEFIKKSQKNLQMEQDTMTSSLMQDKHKQSWEQFIKNLQMEQDTMISSLMQDKYKQLWQQFIKKSQMEQDTMISSLSQDIESESEAEFEIESESESESESEADNFNKKFKETVEINQETNALKKAHKSNITIKHKPIPTGQAIPRNKKRIMIISSSEENTEYNNIENEENHAILNELIAEETNSSLKKKLEYLNKKYYDNKSILHLAIQKKYIKALSLLILKGANVNAKDEESKTPLHYAVKEGNFELVKMLIENGADVNAEDARGKTPLHYAVEKGNFQLIEMLITIKNININAVDSIDKTPLHYAVEKGNFQLVKMLITIKNININAVDSIDKTPLHYAVEKGNFQLVKMLITIKNININAVDSIDKTPLHYAVKEGNFELVKMLIEKGADVNANNVYRNTPLHYAIEKGNFELVKMLIEKGANVNAKNNEGETPLHSAIEKGNFELVKMLIEKGANVNAKNNEGKTPLHSAIVQRNLNTGKILIKKGASLELLPKEALKNLNNLINQAIEKKIITETEYIMAITEGYIKQLLEQKLTIDNLFIQHQKVAEYSTLKNALIIAKQELKKKPEDKTILEAQETLEEKISEFPLKTVEEIFFFGRRKYNNDNKDKMETYCFIEHLFKQKSEKKDFTDVKKIIEDELYNHHNLKDYHVNFMNAIMEDFNKKDKIDSFKNKKQNAPIGDEEFDDDLLFDAIELLGGNGERHEIKPGNGKITHPSEEEMKQGMLKYEETIQENKKNKDKKEGEKIEDKKEGYRARPTKIEAGIFSYIKER